MAGVAAFHDDYTRVVSQAPRQLAVADIDRVDAFCAALQKAVGESTRGCSDIEADEAVRIQAECVERAFEFDAAATDVAWAIC